MPVLSRLQCKASFCVVKLCVPHMEPNWDVIRKIVRRFTCWAPEYQDKIKVKTEALQANTPPMLDVRGGVFISYGESNIWGSDERMHYIMGMSAVPAVDAYGIPFLNVFSVSMLYGKSPVDLRFGRLYHRIYGKV